MLTVNSISAEKITGLTETEAVILINEKIDNINNILNDTTDSEGNVTSEGLVSKVDNLITSLPDTYVSKVDFNATVGDLDTLLAKQKTLASDIDNIYTILTWQELE